jgi:hypothetical protein
MTITFDAPDVELNATEAIVEESVEQTTTTGTKRERDFTKFRPSHQELADYVNENSGLDPITPNQVKAILALRIDFNNLAEQIANRDQRKTEREAARTKYVGMNAEQIKAAKAAERAERQATKLEARVVEAKAKAEALRSSVTASGEDLAAAVEAAQAEVATEAANTDTTGEDSGEGKRRIGRRR